MIDEILVRYLHFIGIIFLSGALVFQHLILKKEISSENFKKARIVDIVYGLSALVVLVAGIGLWLFVGKDALFYTKNYLFHIKFTLFILMALLSIYPTIFFIKNRKIKDEIVTIPKKVLIIVKIEMYILLALPLLAAFVAQGVGYYGS